jgi:hypothetical protein
MPTAFIDGITTRCEIAGRANECWPQTSDAARQ